MWYTGWDSDGVQRIGYAESSDGISWDKADVNPIFTDPHYEGVGKFTVILCYEAKEYPPGEIEHNYYAIYEPIPEGLQSGTAIKYATASTRKDWTIQGTLVSFEDVRQEPTGAFWRDEEGVFHVLVDKEKRTQPMVHFTSEDFSTWRKEEAKSLKRTLFKVRGIRIDDIESLSLGRNLKLWLLNPFLKKGHQSLDMLAGTSWDSLWYVGNCIYPSEEIAKGVHNWSYHEASIVKNPFRKNGFRVYYVYEYDDDVKPGYDIDMAYLMLGKKRSYPLIEKSSLGAGNTTTLDECTEIPLAGVGSLTIQVELTYDGSATADPGARVHLRGSANGYEYDTMDYTSFDVALNAGATVRKTVGISPDPEFLKLRVENLTDYGITDLKVVATLGG